MLPARDPFVGVWELDAATLDYQFGRPGRRATYTIEPITEGLQFTLDADDADGNPLYVVYGGPLDGQDIALPNMPVTVVLNWLDERTIESLAKKDGRVIDRWTRSLSPDGQTMTVRQHGATPDGKEFVNTSIYRRVR